MTAMERMASVVREAARVVVEPPIAFDDDHARIRPESEPSLDALASYLAHHPRIWRRAGGGSARARGSRSQPDTFMV